jgi:hypothetical protein
LLSFNLKGSTQAVVAKIFEARVAEAVTGHKLGQPFPKDFIVFDFGQLVGLTPAAKREAVAQVRSAFELSGRRACRSRR